MENKMNGNKLLNDEFDDRSFDMEHVYMWILQLVTPGNREMALLELGKRREIIPDLAPMLWNTFGAVASIVHEIVTTYYYLDPVNLSPTQSNRVCNALALTQCLASHPETRSEFMAAGIISYLYPFLQAVTNCAKGRSFEYLRLTSLGVIGAMVKTDDPDVIIYLLGTEIMPICLRVMEHGADLSRTVATFILQKILLDDYGLAYICQTYDRFSHINMVLGKMVMNMVNEATPRLLKHILRCYLRLSDNPRAREALRNCLPTPFRDDTFAEILDADKASRQWLITLHKNLEREVEQ